MSTRALIAIVCSGCLAVASQPDEPPKFKPIDTEIIAACAKLNAQHGRFAVDDFGGVKFIWTNEEAAELLPGFRFLTLQKGAIAKTPAIPVAFGLDLHLTGATDADLKELKGLKNLTMLDLHFTNVTDAGLKELKGLQSLTALDLHGARVTDAGLKELKDLTNLQALNLSGTKVTDAGLKDLKNLSNLASLSLESTRVTDAGLKELKELKQLKALYLVNTVVTDAGINELNGHHLTTLRLEGTKVKLAADILPVPRVAPDLSPAADRDFRTLVEQDVTNILTLLRDVKPKKTAGRAIKSNALMVAAFAQGQLGKNAADDAKWVALRDSALEVATTAGKKNFAAAVGPAKALNINIAPARNPNTKKLDLLAATGVDVEELMYQFKKTAVGGLGIEEQIKANAKTLTMKPEFASALAQRVLIVSEFCAALMPAGGFGPAKPRKIAWDGFNKDLKAAATGLTAAANANDAKVLQAAFVKLDTSCVSCHNTFK
jgi:hypothetical protein